MLLGAQPPSRPSSYPLVFRSLYTHVFSCTGSPAPLFPLPLHFPDWIQKYLNYLTIIKKTICPSLNCTGSAFLDYSQILTALGDSSAELKTQVSDREIISSKPAALSVLVMPKCGGQHIVTISHSVLLWETPKDKVEQCQRTFSSSFVRRTAK